MFWKAARGNAILTERCAAGAARQASVACQTSRFRYYLPQIAAEQRLVLFFHLSRADNVQNVLEPRIDKDIILVTDGNNIYPPCAKSLGIKHEALNLSAGERKRGAFNIQKVNNRHSLFKDFLRRYRGVSSKYLGNYLRWFERYVLLKLPPRSHLVITIMDPSLRFAN